jgi:hypothetical protein
MSKLLFVRWVMPTCVLCAALLFAGGCTPSVVMVGEKREAISADSVEVSQTAPYNGHHIARLTIKKSYLFARGWARSRAIRTMRRKAARVGANVVVPSHSESQWQHDPGFGHTPGMAGGSNRVLTVHGDAYYRKQ